MKATVPCYNFLYKHASSRLQCKIDAREQEVEAAEQNKSGAAEDKMQNHTEKVNRALRHTLVTKHVVNLFLKNMSENDQPVDKKDEKHA